MGEKGRERDGEEEEGIAKWQSKDRELKRHGLVKAKHTSAEQL